jgi:WD40 repeat protein
MIMETTETFAKIGTPANPFPGLRPFEFDESHLFFGRDGQSEQLISKLGRTRFLAVVGTSGSGKSSLVRAGLLPTLLGGFMTSAGSDWRVAIMRPGSDPVGNLAQALNACDVFGSEIEENAAIQTAIAEATLRRGNLGLVDAVRQAAMPENENLLVLVDQFEEIFRFARVSEAETYHNDAAAFVKLILEASQQREIPIYVVLTMRSDYLGDCSQFWDLPEAINESQYLIPRLTRDQLREAITGPVAVGGGKITPRLVNRLLNDVGDNQDQLPVLQHLLMRAWTECEEKRLEIGINDGLKRPHKAVHQGDAIDLCCSEAVGGMARALSRHADEAFNDLPDDGHRAVAEKVFKALTEKGPDNREIRRPIVLSEICAIAAAAPAEVSTVVETFRQPGRSFLMPPAEIELNSESLIDISHESLIRGWTRLKEWVEEEARSARIYKRVAEAAMLHKVGEEALFTDPALQTALDWREKNNPNAAWGRRYHPEFEEAMSYLAASVSAREAEAREREQQHRKDVSYKRTRLAALLLLVSLLLAVGASVYAYNKLASAKVALQQAETERKDAESELEEATKRSQQADYDAMMATFDAQDAKAAQNSASQDLKKAEKEKEIARASELRAHEQLRLAERARELAAAEATRNGRLFYLADMNLAHQVYKFGNVERTRALLDEHPPAPGKAPFEWRYLSHLLHIHNAKETLEPPDKGLMTVTTSFDGNTVAVGVGGAVELRSTAAGETKRNAIPLPAGFSIGSLAFSPDNKMLAIGDEKGGGESPVVLYDTQSLKRVGALPEGSGSANSLVFTPGKTLIVGGGDGKVRLWDVSESSSPRKMNEITLQGTINVAVSANGKMAAFTSADVDRNTFPIVLWNLSENGRAGELIGHLDSVTSVTFTSDGKTVASGSFDKTVRLWDVERREQQAAVSSTRKVFSLAFSPDDRWLAIGYQGGGISLRDWKKNEELATLKGHQEAVTSLAFSAGGRLLFSCDNKFTYGGDGSIFFDAEGADTAIKSWDFAALVREQKPVLSFASSLTRTVAYAQDGKTLAVVGRDNEAVHLEKGNPRLSEAARLIVRQGNEVTLLDAETDNQLRRFRLPADTDDMRPTRRTLTEASGLFALSPDGKLSATARGETARLLNGISKDQVGEPLKHGSKIQSIAFSPDGERLATIGAGGGVKLWDTASHESLKEFREKSSLAFSPDGKYIVMVDRDVVERWDKDLVNEPRKTKLPSSRRGDYSAGDPNKIARPVAFARNGNVLAIADDEGRVVIIRTETFEAVATLKTGTTDSLAFSPDSNLLVTGGEDGTVKLWDMISLRESLTLAGGGSPIVSVAFSPDGRKLAAADLDSVRVWRAPVPRDAIKETSHDDH